MITKEINNLTLSQLCDLLVINTSELLDILNQKGSNGIQFRDKKREVETLQDAILKKKSGHIVKDV